MRELPFGPLTLSADTGSFDCGVAPASRSNILAQDDNNIIKLRHYPRFQRAGAPAAPLSNQAYPTSEVGTGRSGASCSVETGLRFRVRCNSGGAAARQQKT